MLLLRPFHSEKMMQTATMATASPGESNAMNSRKIGANRLDLPKRSRSRRASIEFGDDHGSAASERRKGLPKPRLAETTSRSSPCPPPSERRKSIPKPPPVETTSGISPRPPPSERRKSLPKPRPAETTSRSSPCPPPSERRKSIPKPPPVETTSGISPCPPPSERRKSLPKPPPAETTSRSSPCPSPSERRKSLPKPPPAETTRRPPPRSPSGISPQPTTKEKRLPQRCQSMNERNDTTRPERRRQRRPHSILKQEKHPQTSSSPCSTSSGGRKTPGRAASHDGLVREMRSSARRKKQISFNKHVDVKEVAPVSALTTHPEKLWFQSHELDLLTNSSFDLVDRVEAAHGSTMTEEGRQLCLRGLEGWLMDRSEQRAIRKKGAWSSVLGEQSVQFEKGTFDDEAVRNAYTQRSFKCRMEAARRAQQDAKDVEGYLKSTRSYCRRLPC